MAETDALVPVVRDDESGEMVSVTEEMRLEARRVHEDITYHGSRALDHIVELGASLQYMRDRRLYIALDYHSFNAYCQAALGLSSDWAHAQIRIANTLAELKGSGHSFPTKSHLRLLGRLAPDQQQEFLEKHNPSSMTTREMERIVQEMKGLRVQLRQAERAVSAAQIEANEARAREGDLRAAIAADTALTGPAEAMTTMHGQGMIEVNLALRRLDMDLARAVELTDGLAEVDRCSVIDRGVVESVRIRFEALLNLLAATSGR